MFKLKACAVKLKLGQYVVKEPLLVGVPAKIGKNGVEEILELTFTQTEQANLEKSVAAVIELNQAVAKLSL